MKKIVLTISVLLFTPAAYAEDVNKIFSKVNEYISAENYSKALKELQWAEKEIQKLHAEKLKSLLPDELASYKGQEIKSTAAMGFSSLERVYKNGKQQVKLSLAGASGAAGAMGGMAGLGRMAAMMGGQQPGNDVFRIEGRTASFEQRGNRATVSVFLESGSILKLESRDKDMGETLKKMAESLPIEKMDSYLKG